MMTKALEKMEPLPQVKLDKNANQACRAVNDKHLEDPKDVPQPGGCLEKLKEIEGEGKSLDGSEFTMVQWKGNAMDLILLCLLQDYEKNKLKAGVINADVSTVGFSYKAHKKCQNMFQALFVMQASNNVV